MNFKIFLIFNEMSFFVSNTKLIIRYENEISLNIRKILKFIFCVIHIISSSI